MVFFNWATMQMAAKIVYYGPGLCGKTTNLSYIYAKTAPGSRGEMVSLETESDRTLFFDLLPIEVGKVGGFRTRLQLYTVPGQVFYNTTRKLVLKGVDGIVFVADSQRPMAEANVESLQNLEENLRELGTDLSQVPLVLQYNKRDLKNILTLDELNAALNPSGQLETFEAVAVQGIGVFETLKAITKLTLKTLRRRMAAQEAAPPRPAVAAARPQIAFSPAALAAAAEEGLAEEPAPSPPAPPPEVPSPVAEVEARAEETPAPPAVEAEAPTAPPGELQPPPPAVEAEPAAEPLPVAEEVREPLEEAEEAPVEFATTTEEVPAEAAAAPPVAMRHVRVSSSLDILAELENLRKASTATPVPQPEPRPAPRLDLDAILRSSLNSRQEVRRRIEERVGNALAKASRCVVTIRLVDDQGSPLGDLTPVEVELRRGERLRQLALNLTVTLQGD